MQEMTISGGIYRVYDTDSQDYKNSRMPRIGQKVMDSIGRKFVFVSTAVDVAAGQVVSSAAAAAELADKITAAASGSTEVTVTKASVTANQYAGGLLVITAGTSQKSYVIKKNTASGTDDAVVLTLEDRLSTALTATDDCILLPNPYSLAVIGTAASNGIGVAMNSSTAATDSKTNFLWVQCQGIGSAKVGTGASIVAGDAVTLGAAGVVENCAASDSRQYGHSIAAGAVSDTDAVPLMLNFPW